MRLHHGIKLPKYLRRRASELHTLSPICVHLMSWGIHICSAHCIHPPCSSSFRVFRVFCLRPCPRRSQCDLSLLLHTGLIRRFRKIRGSLSLLRDTLRELRASAFRFSPPRRPTAPDRRQESRRSISACPASGALVFNDCLRLGQFRFAVVQVATAPAAFCCPLSVSYTHLTLPTICSV